MVQLEYSVPLIYAMSDLLTTNVVRSPDICYE
jgi:hypothetical protein